MESRIGGALYVKIPVGAEGLKAAMKLKGLGIGVTMTAVFTPAQALMAAEAGADFVAPYVNRLDNVAGGGCGSSISRVVNVWLPALKIPGRFTIALCLAVRA